MRWRHAKLCFHDHPLCAAACVRCCHRCTWFQGCPPALHATQPHRAGALLCTPTRPTTLAVLTTALAFLPLFQVHGGHPVQQGRAQRGQDRVCAAAGHHLVQLSLRLSRHSRRSRRQHAQHAQQAQPCTACAAPAQQPRHGSRLVSTQARTAWLSVVTTTAAWHGLLP